MVKLDNYINTTYNNKHYTVIKVIYKNMNIPIVMDTYVYNVLRKDNKFNTLNWHIGQSGSLHTFINNNLLYLHEIIYYIVTNNKNHKPLLHINKICLDNRFENLMEDTTDKIIKKNLNKKERTIKLKPIDTSKIPSYVWYLKKDKTHGERFQVNLGNIKWKCTGCNNLSIYYKLEETKKFLRQYKQKNILEFKQYSMNSDLNENGLKLKNNFYNILNMIGLKYIYSTDINTDCLLNEDISKLNSLEKYLLKEFNIDSVETTNERLNKFINSITQK